MLLANVEDDLVESGDISNVDLTVVETGIKLLHSSLLDIEERSWAGLACRLWEAIKCVNYLSTSGSLAVQSVPVVGALTNSAGFEQSFC